MKELDNITRDYLKATDTDYALAINGDWEAMCRKCTLFFFCSKVRKNCTINESYALKYGCKRQNQRLFR